MAVKFASNIRAAVALIKQQAQEKKKEVADHLLEQVQEGLAGPRHGETYRIPGTDKTYTASAPGEWPAYRTGALHRSMRVRVIGDQVAVGTDRVNAEEIHSERPFFAQLIQETEAEVGGILNNPWLGVQRGLGL